MSKFPSDFIILINSSKSLFKLSKVIYSLAVTTFISNIFPRIRVSIAESNAIVANGAKTILQKRKANFINRPAHFSSKTSRNGPD